MTALRRRLLAIEGSKMSHARPLPDVVPDDTTADELERPRAAGREVYRWRDAVELFV